MKIKRNHVAKGGGVHEVPEAETTACQQPFLHSATILLPLVHFVSYCLILLGANASVIFPGPTKCSLLSRTMLLSLVLNTNKYMFIKSSVLLPKFHPQI